jgi:hypothetical protein
MRALGLVVILVAGCSHTYSKPGASREDFADDKQFCALYAHQLGTGAVQSIKFRECMEERGWERQ